MILFKNDVKFIILTCLLISMGIAENVGQISSSTQDHSPFDISVGENILISTSDEIFPHHVEPTLALSDNGDIAVGWKNAYTADGGGASVSYSFSSDGTTWSSPGYPTSFWPEGSSQSDPWMHYYGGTLYFLYIEFNIFDSQCTMSYTSDNGLTWDYSRATFGTGFADKETFTIDENGNIFLVYDDVNQYSVDLKLSRSFDGGVTFVENVTISDYPDFGYLGGYITTGSLGHVFTTFTYLGDSPDSSDIFFDQSLDFGETWSNDIDLNPDYNASTFTSNPNTGRPEKVSLSVVRERNDVLYVAWSDVFEDSVNKNWDVYLKSSDDFGGTWSNNIRINELIDSNQWMPDFDFDSLGNLHFIYYDSSAQSGILLKYRIYDPVRNIFSEEVTIPTVATSRSNTRPGDYVTIRIDSNDIAHVVWTDGRNENLDIYYSQVVSTDFVPSGDSSQSNTNIGDNSSESSSFLNLNLVILPILISLVFVKKRQKNFP